MQTFGSVDEILDFAIKEEKEAADFYMELAGKMGYQEALILAMQKEKASFKLYTDLAAAANEEDIKQSLLSLAQDEARHKLRFEIEYDNLLSEG